MTNKNFYDDPYPKKSKAELKASEAHYRRFFEAAKDGILIIDASTGKVLDVNPFLVETLGYPRQEIVNKAVWELGFLKNVFADKDKLVELQQKEYVHYGDLPLETAEGCKIDIELVGNVYDISHQKLIQLSIRNISERKKIELKLKESEERFRQLIEDAPIGIAVSREGKTIYVNSKYLRMFGFQNQEELYGHSFLDQIAEQDRDEVTQRAIKQEQGQSVDAEYDIQGLRKDGTQFPFQAFVAPIVLSDGPALIGYFTDVTNRKNTEAEAQQLRDKAEMSSRLVSVGEMAAGIAHEINNPLTAVIGFSELLMDRKDLPEDVIENLQIINSSSQRVKGIISRMLAFARRSKPMKSRVNIKELIDNTLELRSYVLRTANIEVIRDYDPDLPWVIADPVQLQQVILNLIVNAEYAMKKYHDKGRLTVKTEKLDYHIRVSVIDDGPGMSDKIKTKLFQPFFTTKNPGEGTGLGLALSFGIIQAHGGTITAESEVGKGAKFVIELPITQLDEGQQPEEPAVIGSVFKKVKTAAILVADDEPVIRSLIKSILTDYGHTVELCDQPEQVLEKLGQNNYDVILLDIRMPGMSGMELYKEISTRWPLLSKRVIFFTGDTSDATLGEYLATHKVPYIAKPFERKTLEEKVNAILAK